MFNNELWNKPAGGGGGSDFYTYQIAQSFRWTNGAAYLNRTPSAAGNRQTWTFSCWLKASGVNVNSQGDVQILGAGSSGNQDTRFRMYFYNSQLYSSSNEVNYNTSPGVYRDPSAWYHVVWKLTGGTSYQYVNGTLASSVSVSGNVAINNNVEHLLGILPNKETISKFKGYMAEVVFIDGTALDPTSFAESKNGVWIPKDPSTLTFGSQGYHLDFADASAPGNDVSGNNNDWTNVGLATHDKTLDSPTFGSEGSANFPTANVLDPTLTAGVVTNGNLQLTEVISNFGARANFAVPLTGKWYWEAYVNNGANQEMWAGITGITTNSSGEGRGGSSNSNTYGASWSNYSGSNMYIRKYIAGTESAVSGSFGPTSDTILGVAVNRDDNEAKFYKNNVLQFTTTISATQEFFPAGGGGGGTDAGTIGVWNFGQDGTFAGNETAQGNADGNGYGDFYYAPPTDFLALCAANLPTAAEVDPAQTDDNYPQELFFMSQYTGNGTARTITTANQPDLMFLRHYSSGQDWYTFDSTRVITDNKVIITNNTDAESVLPQGNVTSVGATSVGISSGTWLNSGGSYYQMWMWRANGGTTSSNTQGDLTSTVQVDPSGGFSIVTYTGTLSGSGTQTVGHGLSKAPSFIITKIVGGVGNWWVFSDGQTSWNYGMNLNNSNASVDKSGNGSMSAPTSTVFDTNWTDGLNDEQGNIAYCFANTEGYIKAGSYYGNGNADGPSVYTGFRPALVMVKFTGSGENWVMMDTKMNPYNVADNMMRPSTSGAESVGSTYQIDILSNGFKPRTAWEGWNGSAAGNGGYVYLAFAKNPFQYATAR